VSYERLEQAGNAKANGRKARGTTNRHFKTQIVPAADAGGNACDGDGKQNLSPPLMSVRQ
jgi:hypothetical protein